MSYDEAGSDTSFRRLLPGGIRPRLFLLVALMVLPLMALLGWIYRERFEARKKLALMTELEVAAGVATTFAAYLEGIHHQCRTIGEAITTLSGEDIAGIRRLLILGADHSPTIRNLSWVGIDGTIIASSSPLLEGKSFRERPFFKTVTEGGAPFVLGDITSTGTVTPMPTVTVAAGARNGGGTLAGIVVASMEPSRMGELILVLKRPEGGAFAIFDRQGTLVYHSRIRNPTWEDRTSWLASDPALQQALASGHPSAEIMELKVPGGTWVGARVPLAGLGWVAGAGTPTGTALASLRRGMTEDLLMFAVVSVAAFFLAYLLSRTIVEPLKRVEADAEAMSQGETVSSHDPGAPVEVANLRQTLARLAAEQIRRGEALRESEASLRTIFDNVYDGIIIHAEDGRILDFNQRFLEMYRLPTEQAGSLTVFDLSAKVPSRTELYELWHDVMEGNNKFFQWLARRLDGSVFDVEVFLRRVTFNGREAIMANIRNISERKRVEEELQRAKEELESRVQERTRELELAFHELQRESRERLAAVEELRQKERLLLQQNRLAAMGEMIGNIAHQWRQPLNTIGLLIQELTIAYELGNFSREYLQASSEKAMQVLHHMSRTIDDFRNFFKPDKGKATFSINSVVAATVSLMEASLKAYEITIDVVERDDLVVEGFPSQFSQAILNILTNARDALQERGIAKPRIEVELFCEDNRRVVTISDNAGGIGEDVMDRIFEPYFTTKAPDKGTGIGLFMAKTIIEKNMGGRLTAGNIGTGAQFRIEV